MNSLDKDTPEKDDSKKDKGINEQDSSKSTISSKVEGENNDAITIGGNVSESNVKIIDKSVKVNVTGENLTANFLKIGRDATNSPVTIGDNNIVVNVNDSFDVQALAEYGRFFVIGLCFYHGLSVPNFSSVLDVTRKYLSQKIGKGNKINFPSRHPDVKTIEEFDSERLAVTIKFSLEEGVSVGNVLTNIVKRDYIPELFDYMNILDEVVKTQPHSWEIRWRSAVGLGEISELDVREAFYRLINAWAQDERTYVRVTVGYYFYYILSEDSSLPEGAQKFLLEMLEKWAAPKGFKDSNWRYKWTVAAICEKIGHLKNNQAQGLATKYLEQVAGINHIRIADAVVHALVDWSIKEKFAQVFDLLVHWAESGSAGDGKEDNPFEIRCIVALIAFSVIVETHYEILSEENNKQESIFPIDVLRHIWEKRNKKENLWNGIVSIGVRYFDFKMGHYFFEMIEKWTEIVKDTDFLTQFVSDWLKEIYNIKRPKHLENRLKNVWSKSKNKTLVSISKMTQEKLRAAYIGE